MKKLLVLVLLVMLSSRSFSQTVIQTETTDSSKVVLSVRVARLVYQDLLKYDGLKEEMGFMKLKLQKVEEREFQKDNIITILTQKDENNQFIVEDFPIIHVDNFGKFTPRINLIKRLNKLQKHKTNEQS